MKSGPLALVALALFAAGAAWWLARPPLPPPDAGRPGPASGPMDETTTPGTNPGAAAPPDDIDTPLEAPPPAAPANDADDDPAGDRGARQADWYREHGYLTAEDKNDYLALGDAALEGLAATGDLVAMQVLAARLRVTDPEAAKALYRRAAVFGSTFALTVTASLELLNAPRNEIERRAAIGTALTHTLAASLLGDDRIAAEQLSQIVGRGMLDADGVTAACGAARALVGELEGDRLVLGLGPWQVTTSPLAPQADERWSYAGVCETVGGTGR